MTRRGLLGAAVVVGGAGILDLFRKVGGHSQPSAGGTPHPSPRSSGSKVSEPGVVGGRPSHHPAAPTQPPGHGDSPGHHAIGHNIVDHHGGVKGKRNNKPVNLPPAQVRVRKRPIYSVDELIPNAPKHAIALTIDDGPDPDWTPKVLRILDKYNMQASFCVVGVHADSYPRLVRDVSRAGHVIVNHSYTHVQPFNRQTEQRIVAEITKTQRAIEKAAKVTPQLFRAPGGAWNPFIFRAVAAYGLIPLDWDIDPMDWAMPGTRKIERAMLKGRPGDIVLCHDGGGNRSETVRALRKVLPAWKHRHYTTIPLIVPAHQQPQHSSNDTAARRASPWPSASASMTPTSSPTSTPSSSPSS